ncbi:MAG: transcriptional antiterminator, partial [Planctomycetota bacterium]
MITRRSALFAGTALGARLLVGQESQAETARLLEAAGRRSSETQKTLRLLLPKGCRGSIAAVGATFEAATGIGLEYREVPVDQVNTHLMVASLSKRDTFHLALPATFGIPDLAETGCILPMDVWAEKYETPGFRASEIYSIGDFYKGKLYGYQTDGDAYLMFYRSELLNDVQEQARFADEYGYELKVPRTW